MAIKLSGNTIIDDSRVIVNADKIGIGQTTPRYDLEIHSNQYGTDIPIGIAVSATSIQGDDVNKAISIFNNSESSTFTVSYRGRVDALEYHGVFKGSIDSGVTLENAEKIKIQTDSSNVSQYLTFVDSTSGYEDVKVHTGIRYNPDFYGNGGSSRLSIDGDVGIAGTLTYEDVTNVDSIGLVTARTGVRITTGGLIVNAGISSFGAHIYPLAHEDYNIGESDSNRFNAVYAKEFRGGTFYGTIDGGVSLVADTVKTIARNTSAEHYLTFVDSNNVSATAESMYTDGSITYNPNTDQLTVSKIKPAGIINASGGSGTANYVIKADGSGGWDWGLVEPGNIGTLKFTDLDDTPANYTSAGGKLVRVNSGANGLEFITASDAGKTYTLDAVDSGDNVKLRLSDGSTNDDVLITAGSNITIDPVAAGGFTIAAEDGAGLGVAASADDILSVTNGQIAGDSAGSDKIVFWDNSGTKLTYLTVGTGLDITGTEITATSAAGKTYTLEGVDSGDNAILRLSDGSTNDDVTITAGTGITLDSVAAGGFTINATGGGSLSDIDVKQFSNHTTTPKTERTCPNPIEVNVSGIGATIGIGSTSNAYGRRYIQDTAPSTGVCEGDIWFDISTTNLGSSKVAVLRDEKAGGEYGGRPGAGEYANYRAAYMHDGVNEFVADSWFPRNINTKYDSHNFVSVVGVGSTGTFGLESGSYKINWRVPAHHVDRFQSRLAYNTNPNFTGVTTYFYGSSQYSGSDPNLPSGGNYSNSEDESEGEFVITIATTTYFKIEQWIYTEIYYGGGTDFRDSALGVAINRDSNTNVRLNPLASPTEVYTQIKIEDLATAVKSQDTGKTKVAILKDEKNNQRDGGTFNSSAWRDRDLTVEEDPSNFVDFTATPNGQTTEGSGNTPGYWSLPAGDYKIDWSAPAFDVNRHKTRLVYSTTESHISTAGNASTSHVEGSTENTSDNDGNIATISTGHTVINLTQTTWFKIMHYCSSSNTGEGFGRRQSSSSNSDTGTNIYTQVRIEDLATALKDGGGITIKDEGTALPTTATTLNFVGNGVVASGTGADKTISISGGGGIAGEIVAWSGLMTDSDIPNGFFLCDGRSLNKNTYDALFAITGYIHGGSGDNFNIPDLRDKFIVGAYSDGSDTTYPQVKPSATGGAATHTLTIDEMPSHNHPHTDNRYWTDDASVTNDFSFSGSDYEMSRFQSVASQGGGQAHNNLPPYYALAYIINATGVSGASSTGKTRVAILRDKKNNSIPGGKFDQDAWKGRDLTEEIDPQNFVNFTAGGSVSSESDGTTPGTWTLAAGTYEIEWSAPCYRVGRNRSRLTYSTASNFSSASYAYSASGYSGSTLSGTPDADSQLNPVNTRDYFDNYSSTGKTTLELTATTYFKIEHYGTRPPLQSSVPASLLGFGVDAGRSFSPYTGVEGDEIYTTVKITDLATAVKDGAGDLVSDKIEEGNTSAEVIDTNGNGHFLVKTEGTERLRITDSGTLEIRKNEPQIQLIDTDDSTGNTKTQLIHNAGDLFVDLRDGANDGELIIRGKGGDTATEKLRIKGATGTTFANSDNFVLMGGSGAATSGGPVTGAINMGTSYYSVDNTGNDFTVGSGDWRAVKLHLYKATTGDDNATINNVYGLGVSNGCMEIQSNANLVFFVGKDSSTPNGRRTERLRINTSGHLVPGADNAYNLGQTASSGIPNRRWANVYQADLHLDNTGCGGNEVDGTEGSWKIQEGADNLFLINKITGKKYKINMTEVT